MRKIVREVTSSEAVQSVIPRTSVTQSIELDKLVFSHWLTVKVFFIAT